MTLPKSQPHMTDASINDIFLADASRKFDRKDFLKRGRKLLYSCNLQWCKDTTKKSIGEFESTFCECLRRSLMVFYFADVFFLLLTDCFVMLQDNNGKYTFPSGQVGF